MFNVFEMYKLCWQWQRERDMAHAAPWFFSGTPVFMTAKPNRTNVCWFDLVAVGRTAKSLSIYYRIISFKIFCYISASHSIGLTAHFYYPNFNYNKLAPKMNPKPSQPIQINSYVLTNSSILCDNTLRKIAWTIVNIPTNYVKNVNKAVNEAYMEAIVNVV